MNLDNEENYFTRRQNGAIKDKDVEKAENYLKRSLEGTVIHKAYLETILNELKYREAEIEKDNNIISDLQNEVTLKQCELEKKDKIIDLMAERLEHDTEWFFSEFDNYTKQDFIEYFTKKASDENE